MSGHGPDLGKVTGPLPRVVVAMSGGVDSSVAALLLQRQGYEVMGVTMQILPCLPDTCPGDGGGREALARRQSREVPPNHSEGRSCCGLSALDDARQVARCLGIPHYALDFREEFEDRVIGYFCREYLAGRTPNPCIACNRYIKFGSLLQWALARGAEYLATGHYARIGRGADGKFKLYRATDRTRDQSYALYQITQQQLQHTLFPLGGYQKREVRRVARQAGLPVADKAESREICFIPSGNYADFVSARTGSAGGEGLFRSVDGEILGRHRGLCRYTVGQRRGLGLAPPAQARERPKHARPQGEGEARVLPGDRRPLYVIRIDPTTNTVWVGEESDLYHDRLIAEDVNYISGAPLDRPRAVQAKIRYKAPLVEAVAVSLDSSRLQVDFLAPQKAITPGQAVVLYDGDEVLGGGTISEAGSRGGQESENRTSDIGK
jgi:tRNA-specific 2-thiouridylase